MKALPFFCCFLLLLAGNASAQQIAANSHGVTVTGIAEASLEPDYIVVSISNRETQKSKSDENATAEKEGELLQALIALKVDTGKLSVQRINTDSYYGWIFSGNKYSIAKTYTLRIDDLQHYEDIITGIAKAGFKNINLVRLGLNHPVEAEQAVMQQAISAGAAKATVISSALNGRQLRLTSVEELENSYRREQSGQMSGWARGDNMGVAGGLSDSPRNLTFGKVILRKAFLMTYAFADQ